MIAIILGGLSISLLWVLGGNESAQGELVVKVAYTTAILLAFPLVYAWTFLRMPAAMHREMEGVVTKYESELVSERDKRPLINVRVLHHPTTTMYGRTQDSVIIQVTNNGAAGRFSGQIELQDDENASMIIGHDGVLAAKWHNTTSDTVEIKYGQTKEIRFTEVYGNLAHLHYHDENEDGLEEIRLIADKKGEPFRFSAKLSITCDPSASNGIHVVEIAAVVGNEQSKVDVKNSYNRSSVTPIAAST